MEHIKDKEIKVLRGLLKLEKTKEHISPTELSNELGYKKSSYTFNPRMALFNMGFIGQVGRDKSRALMWLTESGRQMAMTARTVQECRIDSGKFVPKKSEVSGAVSLPHGYRVSTEYIAHLYRGRRYGRVRFKSDLRVV